MTRGKRALEALDDEGHSDIFVASPRMAPHHFRRQPRE